MPVQPCAVVTAGASSAAIDFDTHIGRAKTMSSSEHREQEPAILIATAI